jgi:peroxiredoxin
LRDLNGETITLDALRSSGKPITLIFSDPGCGPCNALLPEAARWQRDYAGKLTLAFISRGKPQTNRAKATEHQITRVLLQKDHEVSETYQAIGTPSAVLIRSDGTIGAPLAQGADAIRALVASAVGLPVIKTRPTNAPNSLPITSNGSSIGARSSQPAQLKIGDPAPSFTLPDLTGKSTQLADFQGNNTLLLFWNPGCGFCQRMLEDLKAWEANPPDRAPKLLVISTGTVEANQAQGLRSPVLLDQNFSTGRMYNATGTPMAVLIDASGNIASEVVAGAPAVLALVKADKESAQSARS